jgi:hypothetical protein
MQLHHSLQEQEPLNMQHCLCGAAVVVAADCLVQRPTSNQVHHQLFCTHFEGLQGHCTHQRDSLAKLLQELSETVEQDQRIKEGRLLQHGTKLRLEFQHHLWRL